MEYQNDQTGEMENAETGIEQARREGAEAGAQAAAELDEPGLAYEDKPTGTDPDDETKDYPLHSEPDEEKSEDLSPDNSSEEALRSSGEALLAQGDYDSLSRLIDERAIVKDDLGDSYRSSDTIIQAMRDQGLSLKGNQIWQDGRHVGDAKIETMKNPLTGTVSITNIQVSHV